MIGKFPEFAFTPAISFFVNCKTQVESIISGRNSPRREKKGNAVGCEKKP
jgi:hypothetical protein